jgi:DNA-binding Lrp family transcriptional regulator
VEPVAMDEIDYRILDELQSNFPLTPKPYEAISAKLKIPCDQLTERLAQLMADGVIRRLGASLDSRKLGFRSTLAAISVDNDVVSQASEIIDGYPEITHSYLRDDRFNVWFTVIASDDERIESILNEIQEKLSLENTQILNLPMKRLFKLNARFNILPS